MGMAGIGFGEELGKAVLGFSADGLNSMVCLRRLYCNKFIICYICFYFKSHTPLI